MPAPRKSAPRRPVLAPRPRSSEAGTTWEHLSQILLCITLFLVPLTVSSWTPDVWETPKLMVLMIGISLAWLSYLVGSLKRGSLQWHWHVLDWPVLGIAVATIVGAALSVHPWLSFVGMNGSLSDTLPVTLGFVGVYFLLGQLFERPGRHLMVWGSVLGGIGTALFLQLFQYSKVPLLPDPFRGQLFSTLANSAIQIGLLSAIVGVAAFLLWPSARERWARLSLAALIAIAWLNLLFLGQTTAWAMFALGMLVVVVQAARVRTGNQLGLIITVVGLAALGLIAQLTHVNRYADLPTPTEISLDQSTSWQTMWTTLQDRPVLGSGPSTWYQDFVQHRPESFNASPYWSERFVRSGSAWTQMLATLGILGTGMWVATLLFAAWMLWKARPIDHPLSTGLGLLMVLMFAVAGFFTTWSFILMMTLWVSLGLARGAAGRRPVPAQSGIGATLVFTASALVLIIFWFGAIRVYASQIYLQKSQNAIAATQPLDGVEAKLKTAISLDSHNLDARALLANVYAVKVQLAVSQNQGSQAQTALNSMMDTLRGLILADRNNPAVYEAANNLINSLAAYVPDAAAQANLNFQKLQQLEPTNPIHDVGFGQTLMAIRSQQISQKTSSGATDAQLTAELQAALQAYANALAKKPDYLQARFARAQAYVSTQQYTQAKVDIDTLLVNAPQVAQFWSAEGTILAKLKRLDDAKTAFDHALTLDTQDAGIYSDYATALSDSGDKAGAKSILQKGLVALPSNQALQSQLNAIK